jgi:hypothetical protein
MGATGCDRLRGTDVPDRVFRDVTERLARRLAALRLPALPPGVRVLQCMICAEAATEGPGLVGDPWAAHDDWCQAVQTAKIALFDAALAVAG